MSGTLITTCGEMRLDIPVFYRGDCGAMHGEMNVIGKGRCESGIPKNTR